VFDMDGLLIDSERLARDAFEEGCRQLGVVLAAEVYSGCIGANWADTGLRLAEALGSDAAYRELRQVWDAAYWRRIDGGLLNLKPGAVELLDLLLARQIPLAVATSTERPQATRKLTRTGLLPRFRALICGGETSRGKPHPEPYLVAAQALGLAAAECLALEDSENGVRAAHSAGMTVIQVPDLLAPSDALRALGHRVARDLFEVRDALLCSTGRSRRR
jgi:HAD superfamily hydrolase (TIGR01509 family)